MPGPEGSGPHSLLEWDGRLWFFASGSASSGEGLWTSDGSAAGTELVADLAVDGSPSRVTEVELAAGRLFFVAANEVTGPELWVSRGTAESTRLLEIRPGSVGAYPGSLTAIGGLLLFAADDGEHGREPWVSLGTPASTRLYADVAAGEPSSHPGGFTAAGGFVFFEADDGATGRELFAVTRSRLDFFRLTRTLRETLADVK